MSVELRPLGVACNIMCQYCYQNPQRDAGLGKGGYDMEAMKAAILEVGGPFSLFGGEPLMVPEEDLEELWSWGHEHYGHNSVQTNGVLINSEHIRMFKTYDVRVGISVDGPGDLNDVRWAGSLDATRDRTQRTQAAIERLCREGIPPNLILTLHRHNAAADRLPRMAEWIEHLAGLGVRRVRLHMLESDGPMIAKKLALDEDENIAAFLFFADLEDRLDGVEFDIFRDMRSMLVGDDEQSACVLNACDPYSTQAVQGVEGQGQRSNCGRTNKDGIDFVKSDIVGHERQLALYHTSQDHGGCQDCRFFLMCKGNCPGTSLGGDWRNRSEHCRVWMALYEHFEGQLLERGVTPLSRQPIRQRVEHELLSVWKTGGNATISSVLGRLSTESTAEPMADDASPEDAAGAGSAAVEHAVLDPLYDPPCRGSWVSDKARALWLPRMRRIQSMWRRVRFEAVARGTLPAALEPVDALDIQGAPAWSEDLGLQAVPLNIDLRRLGRASFLSEPDEDLGLRVWMLICRPDGVDDVRRFLARQPSGMALARWLGHPRCCAEAHATLRREPAAVDPVWQVAMASVSEQGVTRVSLDSVPETNILLRSIDLRAIPHLPCSFECRDSVSAGRELLGLAEELGFHEPVAWLREILCWPLEWSALHGIAEVKTPVLKLLGTTVATPVKYVLQLQGSSYPEAVPTGLRFPYRRPQRRPLTSKPAFLTGLDQVAATQDGSSRA